MGQQRQARTIPQDARRGVKGWQTRSGL